MSEAHTVAWSLALAFPKLPTRRALTKHRAWTRAPRTGSAPSVKKADGLRGAKGVGVDDVGRKIEEITFALELRPSCELDTDEHLHRVHKG
jgi:hypothetical protein